MKDLVVVLYNIRSLHNVGSIFRTADAAGVSKIYLCGITPAPIDRLGKLRSQFSKVSLGAEKYVEWEKCGSAAALLRRLMSDGYRIFAVEQSKDSIPYHKIRGIRTNSQIRVALVLGNEVRGLPSSILKRADKVLEIPMKGGKESLNVSVAFGIVVFYLLYGG
jgi:23S rRNA (guanosine2251-2'-O)-methyltransferase